MGTRKALGGHLLKNKTWHFVYVNCWPSAFPCLKHPCSSHCNLSPLWCGFLLLYCWAPRIFCYIIIFVRNRRFSRFCIIYSPIIFRVSIWGNCTVNVLSWKPRVVGEKWGVLNQVHRHSFPKPLSLLAVLLGLYIFSCISLFRKKEPSSLVNNSPFWHHWLLRIKVVTFTVLTVLVNIAFGCSR